MNIFGSALASYSGRPIDLPTFLLVQLIISSVQLSGQTANEFADVEGDALNKSRTLFSGGSGMLPNGRISKRTAAVVTAALSTLAVIASGAMYIFALGDQLTLPLIAIGLFLAIEYSLRPLRLESSGIGEVAMAVTVGLLCPAVAFIAQGGSDLRILLSLTAVAVLTTFCLLIMVEYPDYEADKASGKNNLVVRFGRGRSFLLGTGALIIAVILSMLSIFFNIPMVVAASLSLTILVEVVALNVIRIRLLSKGKRFGRLTTVSIGLYALAIGLAALFLFA
jgi:1,4-dihydroxy-2-naphthoate polyprenyltransferase